MTWDTSARSTYKLLKNCYRLEVGQYRCIGIVSGKTTVCVWRPFYGGPLGRVGASQGFEPEVLCLIA